MSKTYRMFLKNILKRDKEKTNMNLLSSIIYTLGNGISIILIVKQTLKLGKNIGTFNFYFRQITILSENLYNFSLKYSTYKDNLIYTRKFKELLDLKPKIKNGTVKLKYNKPLIIEFKNVWFRYPANKKYTLKNINLVIRPKEKVAFIGENGAGKTTLIKLLMRIYNPTKGKILLNGIDIKEIDYNGLWENIALLTQNYNRYHFTVEKNIKMGRITKSNKKEIIKAAKQAQADDFIQRLPNKYN